MLSTLNAVLHQQFFVKIYVKYFDDSFVYGESGYARASIFNWYFAVISYQLSVLKLCQVYTHASTDHRG